MSSLLSTRTQQQHVTRQTQIETGVAQQQQVQQPQQVQQRRHITFNEAFKSMFPAIFAVVLSILALSAIRNQDSLLSLFSYKGNLGFFPDHKTTDPLLNTISRPEIFVANPRMPDFDREAYEKLGAFTSGIYWETKARLEEIERKKCISEQQQLDAATNPEYEQLGAKCSSSYWENKYRLKERLEKCQQA
ncbi:hypothetical protein SAMD00019534_075010 [Acytostelium subglobosum LB1]|uniref:hypothetical protein n=1 Tax=Acytostelium subglobosum LB1 TaxID=1410327 RepID=UPI000644CA84|nr:hypothetical protein SAMD00019534_075010 [Acytostelium subglobosum LB1]GAM24326.1 hypothetical protein SAMD00019534_075010 [Acytostelium subglobosum LB1]|eukprot:XP_012752652.1 hypothetical protein SAMD00019534_075010 [Acytostelium subglobosum LB1]